MKITISRKQRVTFTPEVEDKKATESARKDAPPKDRDDVEPVMIDADYTLLFWPLTLGEEEDVMAAIQTAPVNARGAISPHPSVVNRLIAKKLCGWTGIYRDEGAKEEFPFDPEWDGSVPDEVIQAFDVGVRAAAFSFLLQQAGMGAEEAVGKPE